MSTLSYLLKRQTLINELFIREPAANRRGPGAECGVRSAECGVRKMIVRKLVAAMLSIGSIPVDVSIQPAIVQTSHDHH